MCTTASGQVGQSFQSLTDHSFSCWVFFSPEGIQFPRLIKFENNIYVTEFNGAASMAVPPAGSQPTQPFSLMPAACASWPRASVSTWAAACIAGRGSARVGWREEREECLWRVWPLLCLHSILLQGCSWVPSHQKTCGRRCVLWFSIHVIN